MRMREENFCCVLVIVVAAAQKTATIESAIQLNIRL